MINNFESLNAMLYWQPGHFYKFEALVRNTDGPNPLYYEGASNVNKNILIKSWWVDSQEYFDRIKNEMIQLCELTGARLYMTLDRKSIKKVFQQSTQYLVSLMSDYMDSNVEPTCKQVNKVMASYSSKDTCSDHNYRTLMWDVDTKDKETKLAILDYIYNQGQVPFVLETNKGYHIVCFKRFRNTLQIENAECKSNQLGLIYMR